MEVAYERAGTGAPLVLAHGAGEDVRTWRAPLRALANEFTVVAWDEPGAGHLSPLERPDAFTAAVRRFCRAHSP